MALTKKPAVDVERGPVLLDVESRSRADLEKLGGRLYWRDPTSEVVCIVLEDTETGDRELWLQGMPTPSMVAGRVLGAHNMMGFDRFAVERLGWRESSDPTLIDTAELARRGGWPAGLDKLGTRLLGTPKDDTGSKITKALSGSPAQGVPDELRPSLKAYRKALKNAMAAKVFRWPEIPADVLERVCAYCDSDVDIMAACWPHLRDWLEVDAEVSRVERKINDRGIAFDVKAAHALLRSDAHQAQVVLERIAAEYDFTPEELRAMAMSPKQFCEVTGAPNAKSETVELMDHPLAEARMACASIIAGKLKKGLLLVHLDGRLRDITKYYGGHTGRWSGQGFQPHNMPRPPKHLEGWTDMEILKSLRQAHDGRVEADVLDVLIRAVLYAPKGKRFVVCDFSGVESRALAWCAGDWPELKRTAEGVDPYKTEACGIYGVRYEDVDKNQRSAGKVSVLACGYGGGRNAVDKMARSQKPKVDLDAAGTTPQAVVNAWRKNHPATVQYWKVLEKAFKEAAKGRAVEVPIHGSTCGAVFRFQPSDDGQDIAVILPSGRPIVYREVRLHNDGCWPDGRPKQSVSYWNPTKKGGMREHTYGGKLAENIVQAMCRCILGDVMVQLDEDGLTMVLTVHDEIVCEEDEQDAEDALACVEDRMSTPPEWAAGFPLACDGYIAERYRK